MKRARLSAFILILFFAFVGTGPLALAAKRVALVVGNNTYVNYPSGKQLKKAENDARAMQEVLRGTLGFEVVFAEGADWKEMNARINEFEGKIGEGDIAFIYFSGHGVSIGAENYLLPSDVPEYVAGEEGRISGNSFGADELNRRIQKKGARAIFAVLDACRENLLETEGGKSIGVLGGLRNIEAADGIFVLFAAGLGQTALDRLSEDDPNPNSVFTRTLVPLLKTGGLSQVDLAKRVQTGVSKLANSIGFSQVPAYYDQILGLVTLNGGGSTVDEAEETAITKPANKPAIQKGGDEFVVQLASFANLDAATSEYRRLEEAHHEALDGLSSQITVFQDGDRILFRLSAGPLPTKEEAQNVCRQLIASGEPSCWARLQ